MKYNTVGFAFVVLCAVLAIGFSATSFKEKQQEKTFKIELTATQVNSVLKGLQELPYKEASEVINSIYRQAQFQARDTMLVRPPQQDTTKKKK